MANQQPESVKVISVTTKNAERHFNKAKSAMSVLFLELRKTVGLVGYFASTQSKSPHHQWSEPIEKSLDNLSKALELAMKAVFVPGRTGPEYEFEWSHLSPYGLLQAVGEGPPFPIGGAKYTTEAIIRLAQIVLKIAAGPTRRPLEKLTNPANWHDARWETVRNPDLRMQLESAFERELNRAKQRLHSLLPPGRKKNPHRTAGNQPLEQDQVKMNIYQQIHRANAAFESAGGSRKGRPDRFLKHLTTSPEHKQLREQIHTAGYDLTTELIRKAVDCIRQRESDSAK